MIHFISFEVISQNKELEEKAYNSFENKDYKKSYDLYDLLYKSFPNVFEYKFKLGYSAIYCSEKKARALEIFEDIKKTDKSDDVDYYLAKSYHVNYRFNDAIVFYNKYLEAKVKKSIKEDKIFIDDAHLGIANCNNGKILMSKKILSDIKNIGSPLNTNEDESVPIISADESVLIYTYVGEKTTGGKVNDDINNYDEEKYYHEDVFISKRENDSIYSSGEGIGKPINTNFHDAAIALSSDGNTLFLYKSSIEDKGDIYVSNLKGDEWSTPERLNSNINTNEWEGSCSISSDGRYLYFASERAGGMGGRDLYVSEKLNGEWGPAKNLGPEINTIYNEDAPFIHPDGITLYFSSQGHSSIGGYDIMYSVRKDNIWINPINMGIPLNTTEDDRYYVINARGTVGYFSSDRGGVDSKGGEDIYTVTPGVTGERPVLALLKGNVFADDKLTEAKIEITKKDIGERIGPYYANSKTGKYLLAISPGFGYKIKITVPETDPIEEDINIEQLHKYVEINKDFYLYSPSFVNKKKQITIKSILDSLLDLDLSVETFNRPNYKDTLSLDKIESNSNIKDASTSISSIHTNTINICDGGKIPDFTALKGKSLNTPTIYKQLLDIGGQMCAEGLVFKVQIAAYRQPENYKYDHLKEFGSPEVIKYPDGVTRFTQFTFKTINEAEVARQKIITNGQKDAWIVGFIDGKRFTLEELILVNFFGKAVN